jgi:hypothetical protein
MDHPQQFSITHMNSLKTMEQVKEYLNSLDLHNKKNYLKFYEVDIIKYVAKELFNSDDDDDDDDYNYIKPSYFSYQEKN